MDNVVRQDFQRIEGLTSKRMKKRERVRAGKRAVKPKPQE
jgi:hypothetical protein